MTICVFVLTAFSSKAGSATSRIDLKIAGLSPGHVYLACYKADKLMYIDTLNSDIRGEGYFASTNRWHEGLYVLVLPSRISLQFIMGADQEFSIETALYDIFNKLTIRGADESSAFVDYQKQFASLQNQLNALETSKTWTSKQVNYKKDSLENAFDTYRNSLIARYPESMLALYLQASVPPHPKPADTTLSDSAQWMQSLYNHRQAYWTNFAANDQRILFTDLYANRLRQFFSRVVPQQADSLITYIDAYLQQPIDTMVYRVALEYLYQEYLQSANPQYEKVLHHLARRYFLDKKPYWVSEQDIAAIGRFAAKLEAAMEGYPLADFMVATDGGLSQSLYEFEPSVGAIVFVKSSCGSCKKLLNELSKKISQSAEKPLIIVVDFEYSSDMQNSRPEFLLVDGKLQREFYYTHFRIYQVPFAMVFDKDRIVRLKTADPTKIVQCF